MRPRDPRLVDGHALAAFLGVSRSTVRMWALRGHLARRGTDHLGRTLFDVDEALAVAAARGHAPTAAGRPS